MSSYTGPGPRPEYFAIAGPRYWSLAKAAFVEEAELPEYARVAHLEDAEGMSTVALLRRTLIFNHFPLGELATEEDKLNKLVEDNKEYLTRLMMLSILGLEIPDEDLEHYAQVRTQAAEFSGTTLAQFLKN